LSGHACVIGIRALVRPGVAAPLEVRAMLRSVYLLWLHVDTRRACMAHLLFRDDLAGMSTIRAGHALTSPRPGLVGIAVGAVLLSRARMPIGVVHTDRARWPYRARCQRALPCAPRITGHARHGALVAWVRRARVQPLAAVAAVLAAAPGMRPRS